MLYFFILGHNPTLSIAEILKKVGVPSFLEVRPSRIGAEARFKKVGPPQISQEVLLLETPEPLKVDILMRQLGGTVKIGEIVGGLTFPRPDLLKLILKLLPQRGKIYFGFSLYKLEDSVSLKKFLPEIQKLAMEIKRALQEQGLKARWVTSHERALSSVVVRKNKLLEQGAEIVFLAAKDKIYLGKTLAVQKFEEYSFRDWQRPEKRIKAGMMPPKLAKIMLNLASDGCDPYRMYYRMYGSHPYILLDPFCGAGTILAEAVLMGYQNLMGSDINEEAVKATKKNLNWLQRVLEVRPHLRQETRSRLRHFVEEIGSRQVDKAVTRPNIEIFQSDVRELSKKLKPNSVGAIVTEPYLGPPQIPESKSQIKMIIDNLSLLYLSAFREFKKILKKNGRVVIVFPVFKASNQYYLPILEEIKKLTYKIEIPIPEELRKHPVIKITPRGSIIYSRPDQKVLREIFVCTR